MKNGSFGAVFLVAAIAVAGSAGAKTDGASYDPMALDTFIAKSINAQNVTRNEPDLDTIMAPDKGPVLAQETQRFDSEGYLLGPDGERIEKPLKPRWRVGVFR